MTRAIIFILLKITEVAAVVFGPYLLGSIYYGIRNYEEATTSKTWMCGLGIIFLIGICLIAVGGVILLISLNLDLSKALTKKLKK